MMQARQARGAQIAAQSQVTYSDTQARWIVPSQTTAKTYAVSLNPPSCTCPDFKSCAPKCKHIFAVEFHINQQMNGVALPEVPAQPRQTYKQQWHEYNLAQTNEKKHFIELLCALTQGITEPVQTFGRPRALLADIIFAACLKLYSGMSGRRNQSNVTEALAGGLLHRSVHYNTLSKYLEKKDLTPLLKQLIAQSALPLKAIESDFAVDSSGFSTGIYQRWNDAKWGKARTLYGDKQPNEVSRQDWIKLHICTGVKTNIVTAVEVTDAHANDSPFFAPLVNATAESFPVQNVSGDKAYSSAGNLQLVLLKGGQPYIPFRSNAQPNGPKTPDVWTKMYHFFMYNQESFMEHYHKRSNVETTFSMIKRKFGERLRSKTETAQINELLCKVLCHNIVCLVSAIYELGIEPTFWTHESSAQ